MIINWLYRLIHFRRRRKILMRLASRFNAHRRRAGLLAKNSMQELSWVV